MGRTEWNVFGGLHTNWIFIGIVAITVLVQALIVEFGGDVFRTEPLSPVDWGYSIAIGAGSLVVGAILRLIPVPDMWCCAVRGTSSPSRCALAWTGPGADPKFCPLQIVRCTSSLRRRMSS